ncbi:hypothetical protein GCM10010331_62080 [Streptomyces xanthochromogenes]|uniref:DUF397 domain-containing protein n=1 Tax=Streptomyces xanthochromogenes TaxID=67384 RepID=UPI0016731981|nr:DUF397 domain-containing protein [Streptomyces xanthochromogenes]GHB65856.1 hypothetical protein GCM10010331_62080 [Streptomyces xanthochromogenes]
MDQQDVRWVKSSYSGGSGTECVETAQFSARTAVRDSKRPDGPCISFGSVPWVAFVRAIRREAL